MRRILGVATAVALLAVLLVSTPAGAGPPGMPDRVNGVLAVGAGVGNYEVSPDGQTIVYVADQDTVGDRELYSVPIGGGASVKLNGWLVADGDVRFGLVVSPDSGRVAYAADQDTDAEFELYSVPTGSGTPTKLNGPLPAGGAVVAPLVFTPDPAMVLFLVFDPGGSTDLFRVDAGVRCGGVFATIVGTDAADTLTGTDGPDVIAGLGGSDVINGGAGARRQGPRHVCWRHRRRHRQLV